MPEPRGGKPVVSQQSLQAMVLLVGIHVRKPGVRRICSQKQRAVLLQVLGGFGLQGVLVFRVGLPAADADVLNRL